VLPRIRIDLSVDLGSRRAAESILNALLPDNVELPEGMAIDMDADSTGLHVAISYDLDGADTLAATLNEILDHIRLAYSAESRLNSPP